MKFNKRKFALLLIDIFVAIVAFWFVIMIFNVDVLYNTLSEVTSASLIYYFILFVIYITSLILFMYLFRVTKCVWRYSSFGEYVRLLFALACTMSICFIYAVLVKINYIAVVFIVAILSVLLIAIRLLYATLSYQSKFNQKHNDVKDNRTLIIGAGWTANTVLREILINQTEFEPICILDDDPSKRGMLIHKIPVVGKISQIEEICNKYDIHKILFAIPSMDEQKKREVLNECLKTNCKIKSLSYIHEMASSTNLLSQIQDIKMEDLLGREVKNFDSKDVLSLVKDKVCLVTGGGGSIGGELCNQISSYSPKKLIIVDIYENTTYEIEQDLKRKYAGLNLLVEICSVTDYDKMDSLFKREKPQIVFHAAAHKHVPLMETVPEEAIKNNVVGTENVAKLSVKYEAEKFVLISTDKAVNPTSVMGASKRICEMIMQTTAKNAGKTKMCAVRFGNVLGSHGSVVPLFKKQLAEGGPITVTDKNIVRFFMTISEAVSLVLEAANFAENGEIFVLDMGKPVKILTLAENIIKLSNLQPYVDVDIVFTGLRHGEKLYEEVLIDEEGLKNTSHNKIFVGAPIKLDGEKFIKQLNVLKECAYKNDTNAVIENIKVIVPTYKFTRAS